MTPAEHSEAAATKTLKCELAAEVLRSFGTLRFAATGWSMLPSVWPGETLVVDRIEPDGTVHAGCHVVRWEEIERIAPQLGTPIDHP